MPKFYLYMKQQADGCDYTIGCGARLRPLRADTIEAAVREADDDYDLVDEYDRELSEAMIFSAPVHVFDLASMKAEVRKRKAEALAMKKEAAEKAEFERLQKKFEKERY